MLIRRRFTIGSMLTIFVLHTLIFNKWLKFKNINIDSFIFDSKNSLLLSKTSHCSDDAEQRTSFLAKKKNGTLRLYSDPQYLSRGGSDLSINNRHPPFHSPPFTSGEVPVCSLNATATSPVPLILISIGRAGSSATWQGISHLTGHCFRGREYPGSNSGTAKRFFKKNVPSGNNGNWILEYLCEQQIAYSDKGGIIGFKWKPFTSKKKKIYNFNNLEGLHMIAHHTKPQIKVVRSRRNILDALLSKFKHRLMRSQEINEIAHCAPNDSECVELMKKYGIGILVPIDSLLKELREIALMEDKFDRYMKEIKVPHINVTYEELYLSNNAEEWMRIFRFLGTGPSSGLSRKHVDEIMEHTSTSSRFHNVTISNYIDVRNLLVGTEFENLLH